MIGVRRFSKKFCGMPKFLKKNLMSFGDDDEGANVSPIACQLMEKDYPVSYRGLIPGTKKYAHPKDYKIDDAPVKPEVFLYKSGDGHNRIFMRLSFRISPDDETDNIKYTSATCILDAGCCSDFVVCKELGQLLTHRWKKDSNRDYIKVNIDNENHFCDIHSELPKGHQPVNVMGLPFFFALGMQFHAARFTSLISDEDGIVHNVITWTKPFTHL